MYHQQLSYCITQFVEKDCRLPYTVIKGLLKYWPIRNSTKEVMCLGELEEILEATQPAEFQKCMVPLFRQIAGCLNNSHFQKIVLGMAVNRGCYIGQSQSLNISMGQVNSEKLTSLHFHAWCKERCLSSRRRESVTNTLHKAFPYKSPEAGEPLKHHRHADYSRMRKQLDLGAFPLC
uniref:Uncharacterized protein n=2 Tax=Aegilops tauschii subsp. strangulata TaxID=200361 RepID=A0A453LSV1_AEGTS